MRSLRYLTAVASVTVLALAGCSGGPKDSSEPSASGEAGITQSGGDLVTLKIGASPSPHAKILQYVKENLAPAAGIDLDIVEFTDYVQPNESLAAGDLDANFFQTAPYLETESEARGYDFVAGEGIHLEPLAVYSEKVKSLDDLGDGAKIGVINDVTNQGRALGLLAQADIVELPKSGDINVTTVTKLKNLEFLEIEGAQLARSLADVDVAVINGNFAQEAGLAPANSLLVESPENNPSVNILVWKEGTENEAAVKKLEALLHSDEVRDYIKSEWEDGSVIPAF